MFSKRLKELREKNGYSMDKLIELYNSKYDAKMNKSTLSRYENGLQDPIYTVVVNLADFFGVSVDYITCKSNAAENTDEKDDITFDDFTFAMYDEAQHLTEEDKQALLQMARLLKSKTEKKE